MNSSPNFADWSREKKDEYAESRMLEMRQKNAKLMQRYAEVELDRIKAEEHNSAVTKVVSKKEKVSNTYERKIDSRSDHSREWDRGKPDKDHWKSPDHHASYKNYRPSRFDKTSDRKQDWHTFSRNENTDMYRYERGSENVRSRKTRGNYNYKQRDSEQYKVSTSSHLHMSPKRLRGIGQRKNEPQRKSQSSYSDEKFKKNDYNRSNSKKRYPFKPYSRSTSVSDSECIDTNTNMQTSLRASSLWENDKTTEDHNKQSRVEKWVKSVNKSNNWSEKQFSVVKNSGRSYSKFDRFERSSSNSSADDKYDKNFNTSLRENKSAGYNSYFSSHGADFRETKFDNREETPNKTYPIAGKQKPKRSPQYSSPRSNKNETFRKQIRFDNTGYKSYDTKDKYNKSKPYYPAGENFNSQISGNVSYPHEDDTWADVKKDDYIPNDQGLRAHVGQKSTDHNKKQCSNKVEDDNGIWGHIDQEGTHHCRKQYKPVHDDGIWSDYQQDMSKLCSKKRIEEDDEIEVIWSNETQDCSNTDKKNTCKNINKGFASDEEKISVDYKKQITTQDIDSDLCNVKQNVPSPEDKRSNKQFDDQVDDVQHSVSKGKLNEEAEPQSVENPNWEKKQISENDSSYVEAKNRKLMEHPEPVKLNNDSDNVDVAKGFSVQNLENTNVDQDVDGSLQKLTPCDNVTNFAVESLSPSKQTLCISDEQNMFDGVSLSEKNQNDLDDASWSTVSDHSDDNRNVIEQSKTKKCSEK